MIILSVPKQFININIDLSDFAIPDEALKYVQNCQVATLKDIQNL